MNKLTHMYRALFTADLHASNNLPYSKRDPETLVTDRLLDVIDVLNQMCEYACENNIRDIWILGDLMDRRLLDAVTLKLITDTLIRIKSKHEVRLVPGNHEAHDAACRHYTLDAYSKLGFWVSGQNGQPFPDTLKLEGFDFLTLPYLPEARATEYLMREAKNRRKNRVALIHQSIKGGKVGEWVCPDGVDLDLLSKFGYVLSGHFHTPQRLGDTIMYLGAPLQHNFGDRHDERGFWDICLDKKAWRPVLVPTRAPRFHELEFDRADFTSPDLISDGDYVNIIVRGPESKLKQRVAKAEEYAEMLKTGDGARVVKITTKPDIGPAKQRLSLVESGDDKPSWPQIVGKYLDTCDTAGLDRDRLESIGNNLIQEAEHA